MTARDVVEVIELEGDMAYALLNYINPKEIADPVLAELCKDAITALKSIEEILENAEPIESADA